MQTGSPPPAPDVEDGDLLGVHRCAVLLNDRRRHALMVLDELRASRDRLKRVDAATGFIGSALVGLVLGTCTGSLVLATFALFDPLRPTLSALSQEHR